MCGGHHTVKKMNTNLSIFCLTKEGGGPPKKNRDYPTVGNTFHYNGCARIPLPSCAISRGQLIKIIYKKKMYMHAQKQKRFLKLNYLFW